MRRPWIPKRARARVQADSDRTRGGDTPAESFPTNDLVLGYPPRLDQCLSSQRTTNKRVEHRYKGPTPFVLFTPRSSVGCVLPKGVWSFKLIVWLPAVPPVVRQDVIWMAVSEEGNNC